jgi:hypothetical protein
MTRTNLITRTETKHLHGTETKIKTKIVKVEEVVSFGNSTPRHDSMVQDFVPPTFEQIVDDQGITNMVEWLKKIYAQF